MRSTRRLSVPTTGLGSARHAASAGCSASARFASHAHRSRTIREPAPAGEERSPGPRVSITVSARLCVQAADLEEIVDQLAQSGDVGADHLGETRHLGRAGGRVRFQPSLSSEASPTSADTGVRSSWVTSATKRRSRACPASRSSILACRFSAIWLNDAASTPNSSDPAGRRMSRSPWDICTAALLAPPDRPQQTPGQQVPGDRAQHGQHHPGDHEDVAQPRQLGQTVALGIEEVDGQVARIAPAPTSYGGFDRPW